MAESASGEVEVVLKNYLDVLSEKDDDIVKLYEDNYRLRALAEAAVRARDDLEARYRTTTLLVASLQTELKEKAALVAAQQDEADTLRETMADLANLLGLSPTTWSLEGRPGDVVACVARLREAHKVLDGQVLQLQQDKAALLNACLHSCSECETRARQAMSDARELFCQASHHIVTFVHELVATLSAARQDAQVARQETQDTTERLELVSRHAELESARLRREQASAAASAMDELVARHAEQLVRQATAHNAQLRLFMSSACDVVDMLYERTTAAETSWAHTMTELCTVSATAVDQTRTQYATQLQAVQAAHTEEQARLRRLLVEATGTQQKLRAEAVRRKADHVTLEHKYRALMEKSRRARRMQGHAARQLATQLAAQQSATQSAEGRARTAEAQLSASQQQLTVCKRQLAALERTVTAATARNEALVCAAEQARRHELHVCDDLQRHLRALQQQYEAGQRDVRCALVANESALRAAHEAHERGVRAQLATFARDELGLRQYKRVAVQREVQPWADLTESLKDELAATRKKLTAEQTARRLLETQQSEETRLLRQLVTTPSASPQISTMLSRSAVSEEASVQVKECAWLRSRVRDLEQACRKSATVIAGLREELHRERASAASTQDERELRIMSGMR